MDGRISYNDLFLKIAIKDDQRAFKKLFFDFYPSLCVFAGRYISSTEVCEDIVQEVFLNIWENRKTLEIHTSFRNFLITSVRNKCNDYLRRRSTHDKYLENRFEIDLSKTPDDVYTLKELQEMLQLALEKLSPHIREAFEMSRSKKMTYKEIAKAMDISPKTVESYISQSLKVLREELQDYLPLVLLFIYFI